MAISLPEAWVASLRDGVPVGSGRIDQDDSRGKRAPALRPTDAGTIPRPWELWKRKVLAAGSK